MTISPEVWFPVVTLVVGVLLTQFSDWQRLVRESREGLKLRQEDRIRGLLTEQRDLLIQVNIAVSEFARSIWLVHSETVTASRATGGWGNRSIAESVNTKAMEDQKTLSFLRSRILFMDLRQKVGNLNEVYASSVLSRSEEESLRSISAMASLVESIHTEIGTTIRSLDIVSFGSVQQMADAMEIPSQNFSASA